MTATVAAPQTHAPALALSLVPSVVPANVPPLAARQRAVLALFGDDARDPSLPSFRAVLVAEVARLFDRLVLPLVRPVWSDVDDSPFLAKWRGGYELYCGLGLSTIVCSARRPRLVNVASRVMRAVGADEAAVVAAARLAIPVVFRLLERERCERTALGAAWILVLDEALDDGMPDLSLDERAHTLRRALRGDVDEGASRELQASAALALALRARCRDDVDHAALDAVLVHVEAWMDGEIASVRGDVDPTGCAFRMAGVIGSMEILLWGVDAYAGDLERDFLYRIAELGQMADDWLDIDKDHAQGRVTPAVTGVWGIDDMARVFARAETILHELAAGAGEPDGPFRALLARTFRGEVQRMARTLVDNP